MRLFLSTILMGFCASLCAQNPIIHNQFGADPTARVFNDTLYLYCSHDIPAPDDYDRKDWFCMHDYHVFSTVDLVHWKDHGVQFSQDDVPWVKQRSYSMWAPDCVNANGRYYLYFPTVAREAKKDEVFGVGIYYLTHALQDGPAEALAYATSNSPLGPFEYRGKIMDIIPPTDGVSDPSLPYCWTNHHSIVEFRGQWYLFYHHNDYSPREDKLRSVRIDSLTFLADGSMRTVVPTFRGVGTTDATSEIQIDRYSRLCGSGSSIAFVNPQQPFDGWYVRLSQKGDVVVYNKVDFSTSPRRLLIRYRSRSKSKLTLSIGKQNIKLPAQREWTTCSIPLHKRADGVKDLSLQLNSGDIDIDWIKFEK